MPLVFEEYEFDPRPQFPLVTSYPNMGDEQNGFTLLSMHGNKFPKGVWEPIIERVFVTGKPNGQVAHP